MASPVTVRDPNSDTAPASSSHRPTPIATTSTADTATAPAAMSRMTCSEAPTDTFARALTNQIAQSASAPMPANRAPAQTAAPGDTPYAGGHTVGYETFTCRHRPPTLLHAR